MKINSNAFVRLECKQCEYQWVLRPKVIRDKNNPKRITAVIMNLPKNCSECKSEYWEKGLAQ